MPSASRRGFALASTNAYIACNIGGAGREVLGHDLFDTYQARGYLTASEIIRAEDVLDDDVDRSPGSGAYAWEALYIPNGTFTLQAPGYGMIDIQIHTVRRGTLSGRRVVKVRDEHGPGGWRAMAFVSRTGHFQLWTRYLSQSEEPYTIAAKAIVECLRENRVTRDGVGSFRIPSRTMASVPVQATINVSRRSCFICNEAVASLTNGRGRPIENPGLCNAHVPVDPAPAMRATIDRTEAEIEAGQALHDTVTDAFAGNRVTATQRRSRATVVTYESNPAFQVQRRTALPLCEVTGTEIQ